jgi:hypothetical protein
MRGGHETDEARERALGRVPLWLPLEDVRLLAKHCFCEDRGTEKFAPHSWQCRYLRMRVDAALDKAGDKGAAAKSPEGPAGTAASQHGPALVDQVEVELLSPGGNNAVVRMPGRRFPGVLVQGDTLASLLSWAKRVETHLQADQQAEALEDAQGLAAELATWLQDYEAVLQQHGIKRPYVKMEGGRSRADER